jgi:hypothetical protein
MGLCLLAAWGCATGQMGDDDGPGDQPDGSVTPGFDASPSPDAQVGPSEACVAALAAAAFDFEGGPSGWNHNLMPEIAGTDVDWNFDDWEQGTATNVGPAACNGGTGCWGTRLDNNYIACQRAFLRSPPIDLTECAGESLELGFYHYYDFWAGEWDTQSWFDGGLVELSADGTGWTAPPGIDYPGTIAINPSKGSYECIESDSFYVHGKPGFVGGSGGWELVQIPIPAELVAAGFQIRFSYSSGVILQDDTQNANDFSNAGWYIDDLAVAPAAE